MPVKLLLYKVIVGQSREFKGNMLVKLFILGTLCTLTYSNKHSLEKSKTVINTTGITEVTGSTTELPFETTELLNTTFASCDDNCTQVNITTESPRIDKNESIANKTENAKNKRVQNRDHSMNTYICTCNLQIHYCDINCCCDPDCSTDNKRIFRYCEIDDNRFVDDRYCNYIKHIYVNNTPFEWEVNQEGLFCVISRNLPESHIIQNEKAIDSIDAFKAVRSFWAYPTEKHLEDDFLLGAKNYAFGAPIIIVKNDSSIDTLGLPKNLITRHCAFREDVVYLRNDKSTCSQIVVEENYAELSFSTFFQDFKVLSNPRTANLTNAKENFYLNCPKNVCIEIESKLCDSSLSNCIEVKNNTNIKFQCSFDIRHNLNRCQNGVKKIRYKFYHNGTNGLYKIEALGVLTNFSYHFGKENVHFDQHFSVEFLWINQTKNYSEIFSGNPGYIIGKPILMASKISNGNKTFIQRISHNLIDNFLTFPDNVEEKCFRNETYNIPLQFGYNLLTKCLFESQILFNISENATCMCRKIQEVVFYQWGIPGDINRSLVVGLFGNAVPHAQEDWTNVLYTIEPVTVLNQTQGNLTNKNTTLICHNISTHLDVKVSYSRVDLKTVLNQHKILGISYNFGNVKSRSYYLQRKNNTISLHMSFELVSQVSFIDITSRKERKFVDPPSLDIRLPYDFFYPFIRVGNGNNFSVPNYVLFIVICLLNMLINV